jgi:hypothetical protein
MKKTYNEPTISPQKKIKIPKKLFMSHKKTLNEH